MEGKEGRGVRDAVARQRRVVRHLPADPPLDGRKLEDEGSARHCVDSQEEKASVGMIPNAFWILPALRDVVDPAALRDTIHASGLSEANGVRGAWLFLAQVLDDYGTFDVRADDALGLQDDFDTDRAFFRDPDTLLPFTSSRALVWKKLQRVVEDAKEDTIDAFSDALTPLRDRFLAPLAARFDEMRLAPDAPAESKEDALAQIATERLVMLTERATKFVQYEEPPGSEKNWAYLLDHRFPAYKVQLVRALTNLGAPKEIVKAVARRKKFDSLEDVFRARPHRGPDPLVAFFEGPPSTGEAFAPFYADVTKPAVMKAQDELDAALLGRPFDVLRSDVSGCVALRSPALLSLMRGELSDGLEKKLRVIRIIHPGQTPWFGYGVYIERGDAFRDYSSWLIFDHIGSMYEGGFATAEREAVEAYLSEHAQRLDVRTVTIDRPAFLRYVATRHPDRNYVDRIEKQRDALAALVLEWLTHEHYKLNGYPDSILSYKDKRLLGDREIDVLALNHKEKKACVAECTLDTSKPDVNRKDIHDKVAVIQRQYPEYEVKGACVTTWGAMWRRAQEDGLATIIKITMAGYDLHILEDHILPNLPGRLRTKHVKSMFERLRRPPY